MLANLRRPLIALWFIGLVATLAISLHSQDYAVGADVSFLARLRKKGWSSRMKVLRGPGCKS